MNLTSSQAACQQIKHLNQQSKCGKEEIKYKHDIKKVVCENNN